MANLNNLVFQCKITLFGIEPPVWRRIQVPEEQDQKKAPQTYDAL